MDGRDTEGSFRGSWFGVLFPVAFLTALGLLILMSAGANRADPYMFFSKQATWLVIALAAGGVATFVDIDLLKRFSKPIAFITAVLLVLVLIPQIGKEVNGSRRWLEFGPIVAQPSDLAKFALIIFLSSYLYDNQRKLKTFVHGLLKPLIIVGIFCIPIILEPDYGTTFLCGVVGLVLIYLAGAKIWQIFAVFTPLFVVFCVMIYFNPVRLQRVLSFLDVEGTKADGSYQLYQAILAFGSGKITGVGIGQGRQQLAFLPEAHTDFVFAIVGEELGLVFTWLVVAIFLFLFIVGILNLRKAPNLYEFSVATGALLMIVVQAVSNMCVVTGLMPTKGISLPFISYGGSNLVAMFAFTGLLINCVRNWSKPAQIRASEL